MFLVLSRGRFFRASSCVTDVYTRTILLLCYTVGSIHYELLDMYCRREWVGVGGGYKIVVPFPSLAFLVSVRMDSVRRFFLSLVPALEGSSLKHCLGWRNSLVPSPLKSGRRGCRRG